jgi:hypothetical protein
MSEILEYCTRIEEGADLNTFLPLHPFADQDDSIALTENSGRLYPSGANPEHVPEKSP